MHESQNSINNNTWKEEPEFEITSCGIYVKENSVCRNKHNFVATKVTKDVFCRDERRVLSRQTRVYRYKHVFVATTFLSRKK